MHFNAINFSLYLERKESVKNYNFRFVMVDLQLRFFYPKFHGLKVSYRSYIHIFWLRSRLRGALLERKVKATIKVFYLCSVPPTLGLMSEFRQKQGLKTVTLSLKQQEG